MYETVILEINGKQYDAYIAEFCGIRYFKFFENDAKPVIGGFERNYICPMWIDRQFKNETKFKVLKHEKNSNR